MAKAESYGDFIIEKMEEYFKRLPEVTDDMKNLILYLFNLVQGSSDGSDDWTKLSPKMPRDYPVCKGDFSINWKESTYTTILDILMKKYPNPTEELPVLNNTILNSKVVKINYDSSDAPVEITTEEGKKYLADHIIVMPSLGVLKADYEKLFNPPLPDKKINAIQNDSKVNSDVKIEDKMKLSQEVKNINYTNPNEIIVTTADGNNYTTSNVIITMSLGVLKNYHKKLFNPFTFCSRTCSCTARTEMQIKIKSKYTEKKICYCNKSQDYAVIC
ncbi:uncharacterized protein LOC123262474 isoform X1 [Cotesia glomerata]|uniref:uncharacterized protein LOC123262474 isoform X1 n=2 Tax=Cotesia glomerata TaxID=32391 RepID=UPI001D013C10|nr:uncharacterized protein LOC123262474 isoform X1 [Cotesia glomerata]